MARRDVHRRDRIARLAAEHARMRQQLEGLFHRAEAGQLELRLAIRTLRRELRRADQIVNAIVRVKDQRQRLS